MMCYYLLHVSRLDVSRRRGLISVLVLRTIGAGQAGYYMDGRSAGAWIGRGCEPLGLTGPVGPVDLTAVLVGRDGGGRLLLQRLPHRHRAGFDLIFARSKLC